MARPTLPIVNVGASGWGPLNQQALAQIYNTPIPLPEHGGTEANLFDAAVYDRCAVWVNHTELGWLLMYSTGTAWRPLIQPDPLLRRWEWSDMLGYSAGVGTVAPFTVSPLASGSANDVALAGMHGVVRIASAAGANSGCAIRTVGTASLVGDTGMACVVIAAYTGAFASASLQRLGFIDTGDHTDAVDGAYFELASGLLAAKTASNSVRTTSGTTFTPVSGTIYRHVIRYVTATSVRFRIIDHLTGAGVYDQTISTNVPTGTARAFGCGLVATTTTSALANHVFVDAIGYGPVLPAEFIS